MIKKIYELKEKMSELKSEIHEKKWGREEWIINHSKYCLKFLYFDKDRSFSMHFHRDKEETWTVDEGIFLFKYIDTKDATHHEKIIKRGDIIHIVPLLPHQLICLEKGRIIEVSTYHSEEDSYRIIPGDSQKL